MANGECKLIMHMNEVGKMRKSTLGIKRHCLSCGARFYDLSKSPIVCPKCDTVHIPEAVFKAKRSKAPSSEEIIAPAAVIDTLDADLLDTDIDVDLSDEDDDSTLIEDTDDLAEDDSMTEVLEHVKGDEDA